MTLVDGRSAVLRAKRLTESVGATIGNTARVVITDMHGLIVFDWKFGEGAVHPPVTFVCPICGRQSCNPHDAQERYCGVCGFVDDLPGGPAA